MKRLNLKKIVNHYRPNFLSKPKFFLPLLLILFTGFLSYAQPGDLPGVTVRFANPQYDSCPTTTLCLDVEFLSEVQGLVVFGMNVRFFYDDNVLEFMGMDDFQGGYSSTGDPQIITGPPGSGNAFGIAGPLEWVNGYVENIGVGIPLSTTTWTKLFRICFHVDSPTTLAVTNFCPTVFWDLQQDPPEFGGGFLPGDDGVVIAMEIAGGGTAPTTEYVEHFNWQYDDSGALIGFPVSLECISTTCGVVPISNWALFLGIGLMLVTSLFIWRRRLNS